MTAYDLRHDAARLAADQHVSPASPFQLAHTHGPFGSGEWWAAIERGDLPQHRVEGTIAATYEGMLDWPEFALTENTGTSYWPQYGEGALYQPGKLARVTYVVMEIENPMWPMPSTTKHILTIKVES